MMAEAGPSTYSTRAAARILAVSPDRIRYWVRQRLIKPAATRGRRLRFAFNDLVLMRMTKDVLPTRRHLHRLRSSVQKLRSLTEPSRPLTALKLEAHERVILVREGDLVFEAETGQLCLQFDRRPKSAGKVEDSFGPARVRQRFDEARRMAEDDPFRALTLYSDLLGREPGNFELHLRMAALLDREGDLAGALRHLLGAAVLMPANAEVHHQLGLLYRKRNEKAKSLQSFLRASECDPVLAEVHRNLAELYEELGHKREAMRHLSTLYRLTRDSSP
ncbi:MAG: MerR family transcriptional regulator [Deltaproteobacteria bacterium]|nr:MerR family transcriptional regulator [Deltaproteobacteria bacterium]